MSSTAGDAQRRARDQLGVELARVRSLAGLGQRELAAGVGLTQSKTSRIESGRAVPSRSEVDAWLETVAADPATRTHVHALLDAAHTQVVAWRSAIRTGKTHLQYDVAHLEATAATVHVFASRVVPGLLQTARYARALFTRLVPLDGHDDDAAVAARIRRQEQLYTDGKHFTFLLTEAALRWSPGPPSILIAQLDRLTTLADLPNIELAVVPAGAEPGPVQHDFTLYLDQPDDQDPVVNVELLHADMTIDDPDDVGLYQREWARWRAAALTGTDIRRLLRLT